MANKLMSYGDQLRETYDAKSVNCAWCLQNKKITITNKITPDGFPICYDHWKALGIPYSYLVTVPLLVDGTL